MERTAFDLNAGKPVALNIADNANDAMRLVELEKVIQSLENLHVKTEETEVCT